MPFATTGCEDSSPAWWFRNRPFGMVEPEGQAHGALFFRRRPPHPKSRPGRYAPAGMKRRLPL